VWAQELVQTGYLHNHTRMWFASIWIFTLRLPWQWGADFFLRHLIDGDPASNTLSWRWVGGLHTKGKTYLARPDNIARYTDGRFHPNGLARTAPPLSETEAHPRQPLAQGDPPPDAPYLMLLTEEDMCGAALMDRPPEHILALSAIDERSPNAVGRPAAEFVRTGLQIASGPAADPVETRADGADKILEAAAQAGVRTVVTAYAPVGPVRDYLDTATPKLRAHGVDMVRIKRAYDTLVWPHAKAGFFGLKKKIPQILTDLKLSA